MNIKEFLDIFGPWILVIAFVSVFISVADDMPEIAAYDNGICTEKFQNETGYYMKIEHATYQIDSQLYKGVLIGEQYDIRYYASNMQVTSINKYTEDSGF